MLPEQRRLALPPRPTPIHSFRSLASSAVLSSSLCPPAAPRDHVRERAAKGSIFGHPREARHRRECRAPRPHPRSLRGSYGLRSRHFFISSLSASSLSSGSTMRTATCRSPVAPLAAMPLPLTRNVRPLEVP